MSEESYEQQMEERQKRSRNQDSAQVEDASAELHSEDARSETWCRPFDEPSCSRAASSENLGPYDALIGYDECSNDAPGVDLYTQLLLGSDVPICFDNKEAAALHWNVYVPGSHGSHYHDGYGQEALCGDGIRAETAKDASSPVFSTVANGETRERDGANNDERGDEPSRSGCFSQDAWTGIMDGIPGSDWANLLAGGATTSHTYHTQYLHLCLFLEWLQDATASAFDDILNNDSDAPCC